MFAKNLKCVLFAVVILGLTCAWAQAATITYVGLDTTTLGSWRTASVIKPFGDDDNRYGSDGYNVLNTVEPSYATLAAPGCNWDGGSSYSLIDNYAGTGTASTGCHYRGMGAVTDDLTFYTATLKADKTFRWGFMVGNTSALSGPGKITVTGPGGASASSGTIPQVTGSALWVLFDVTGANGDTFTYHGTDWDASRVGLNVTVGGMIFDPVPVPEPSALILLGMGLLGLLAYAWRKRK